MTVSEQKMGQYSEERQGPSRKQGSNGMMRWGAGRGHKGKARRERLMEFCRQTRCRPRIVEETPERRGCVVRDALTDRTRRT